MEISVTLIIIIGTVAFSAIAFSRRDLMLRFQFNAYQIIQRREWYRVLSHALLHADWMHLIVNMFVLYSFGRNLEIYFSAPVVFGDNGWIYYIVLYVFSILFSVVYDLARNKNNPGYNAVGASGAVSAVLYANIFFAPLEKVYLFGLLPLPGIAFGVAYLLYSWYMAKRGSDNIGHYAHFWGAVFGFVFPIIFRPELIKYFFSALFGYE